MRELKRAVPMEEKLRRSESVMRRVEELAEFRRAKVVLLYWSMADEVQTHAFVERWYREKTLLLPCVQGDDLVLRRYTDLGAVELIVVPGVAFDSEGNRMGRGRGFYDRLLKSTPRAAKVGVAYDFQMLDHIATEPHDVRMDRVITES